MKNPLLHLLAAAAFTTQLHADKVIPNYAAANLVLGQKDFVSSTNPVIKSSFSLTTPEGVIVDPVSGKVFVSDRGISRVLRYPNASSMTNGAGAEAVFGKPSFSQTSSPSAAANTMSSPSAIFLDRYGRLWVCDAGNHRILMFEAAIYRSDQPTADKVLGQPDFTTSSVGTTASKMSGPISVWVDSDDRLWVTELFNSRVLRFDAVSSKGNGAAADGVLGQTDFTSNLKGLGTSNMYVPCGITLSPTGTLYVADYYNSRVLIFQHAASLGNGSGATGVLGQTDFDTGTSGLSSTKMNWPTGVFLTRSGSLWVSDTNNRRIIRYDNVASKANGAAANGVLGQPNFTTNAEAVNARGSLNLSYNGPFVDAGGSLWIADTIHHRVLRFPPDVTKPLLTLTVTVPKTTTTKSITIKGTASDAYGISKVQYRVNGGSPKTATGTKMWQLKAILKTGKNSITIYATDSVGNVSLSKIVTITRS